MDNLEDSISRFTLHNLHVNCRAMCGRYYRTPGKQALAEAFHAEAKGDDSAYAPGFNIAPTTTQPVLRQERDTLQREIVPMRWGLVGFGSAGIDPKRSTFNARAEGLETARSGTGLFIVTAASFRFQVTSSGASRTRLRSASAWEMSRSSGWRGFGTHGRRRMVHGFRATRSSPRTRTRSLRRCTIACRLSFIRRTTTNGLDRVEVERPPMHLLRPFEDSAMRVHSAHPKVGNVRNQGPEMLNSA